MKLNYAPVNTDTTMLSVSTSFRRVFKRCRKKFDYSSSLKQSLTAKGSEKNKNFWFGSGIHFALEDYHGKNLFGDPLYAFESYTESFGDDVPEGAEPLGDLGLAMLDYYLQWLPKKNARYGFRTAGVTSDGKLIDVGEGYNFNQGNIAPAVEQEFTIDLGIKAIVRVSDNNILCHYNENSLFTLSPILGEFGDPVALIDYDTVYTHYDNSIGEWVQVKVLPVCYHGTMDRIVVDNQGRFWIEDYKTAKNFDTNKLDLDEQITSYLWAAEQVFGIPFAGFVYLQMKKAKASKPNRNKDGTLSVNKNQKTTYNLLKEELSKDYGDYRKAPKKYIDFLNVLAAKEDMYGDDFIRWDLVKRSIEQKKNTYKQIMAEVNDMLTVSYAYPTPTRDCIWDCPFRSACILHQRGQYKEEQQWLNEFFEYRDRTIQGHPDSWRDNIDMPESPIRDMAQRKHEVKASAQLVIDYSSDNIYKEVSEHSTLGEPDADLILDLE